MAWALGPLMRTLTLSCARGQRRPGVYRGRPGAYRGVNVRIEGLTRMFKGLGATNTARRTSNPPKCRPIQPQPSVLVSFCPMGLHCGGRTASSRGLAVTNRGNCTTRASDTSATRRQKASCSANPHDRRRGGHRRGRRARAAARRGPGCGTRGRAAGHGRASRLRTERSSRRGQRAGGQPRG